MWRAVIIAGIVVFQGVAPANADTTTGTANGVVSSPGQNITTQSDGLNSEDVEVTNYKFELESGSGPVGIRWGDRTRATWGSSYATSSEIAYLYYQGRAKAAGNVFDGKRIVQVCIWYSRNNVNLTPVTCSNASSASGSWLPGPEVTTGAWDTLDWGAPKTIFNIQTVRISPTIY